jgi:hypothetical protein
LIQQHLTKCKTNLATNVTQGDKQTKHIHYFQNLYLPPSCGRKLSANYRLVKGVSKIHIDVAELIPHLVQVQNHFQ